MDSIPEEGEIPCFAGVCAEDVSTTVDVEQAGVLLARFRTEVWITDGHPIECHVLAHKIGQSVARSGADLEELFIPYQGECTGGYIHGAMQVLGEEIDLSANAIRFAELCDRTESYLVRVDCLHGYGHAIGRTYDPTDIAAAVHMCDVMRETDRPDCAGGVLMQYYQSPEGFTARIDVALCEGLNREEYRKECHLSRWIAGKRMQTMDEYAKTCSGDWASACGLGLGAWTSFDSASVKEALASCARYDVNVAEACVAGVVRNEVEQSTDDGLRPEKYRSVCEAAGRFVGACTRAERETLELFFGN